VDRAPESPAWQQLRGEEQASIMAAQIRLANVKQGDDLSAIREATAALDLATRRFAELMMEAAVTTAIRGKTMDAASDELGDEVTAPHPMARAEFK
jgi:hypothetical protein